jgi:hypothetical protein
MRILYPSRRRLVDLSTMARWCIALALLLASARSLGAPPDDARLASVSAELTATYTAASRDSVPESILSDKVREGLAKGVPAARIALVVRDLERALADAERQAAPHVTLPPATLLKAMVAARTAGAARDDLDGLLRQNAARGTAAVERALDVVVDLSQHGYPAALAAHAIAAVLAREPHAVDRVPAEAQSLIARTGITRAEALDAIQRATQKGLNLSHAAEALGHGAPGLDDHGPDRETSSQRGPGRANGNGKP